VNSILQSSRSGTRPTPPRIQRTTQSERNGFSCIRQIKPRIASKRSSVTRKGLGQATTSRAWLRRTQGNASVPPPRRPPLLAGHPPPGSPKVPERIGQPARLAAAARQRRGNGQAVTPWESLLSVGP